MLGTFGSATLCLQDSYFSRHRPSGLSDLSGYQTLAQLSSRKRLPSSNSGYLVSATYSDVQVHCLFVYCWQEGSFFNRVPCGKL